MSKASRTGYIVSYAVSQYYNYDDDYENESS